MGASIKQGRAQSLAGGVFGILWTIGIISMMVFVLSAFGGEEGFSGGIMAPFIIIPGIMVLFGIVITISSFYNAFAKERFSTVDITMGDEEPDPMNRMIRRHYQKDDDPNELHPPPRKAGGLFGEASDDAGFCPYCGAKAGPDYEYCRKCGKDI